MSNFRSEAWKVRGEAKIRLLQRKKGLSLMGMFSKGSKARMKKFPLVKLGTN